jgi:hypothetical protein
MSSGLKLFLIAFIFALTHEVAMVIKVMQQKCPVVEETICRGDLAKRIDCPKGEHNGLVEKSTDRSP